MMKGIKNISNTSLNYKINRIVKVEPQTKKIMEMKAFTNLLE